MEELLNLTTIQAIVMTGAVVASVEVIKEIITIVGEGKARDVRAWKTVAVILIAGLVGGLIATSYTGLSFVEGMVYGLSASGVLNVLQNVGKNGGAEVK